MSTLPTHASPRKEATCSSDGPRYQVETWGCQMNVLDGERMAGQLDAKGFRKAADGAADVVILNTCSVREKAEAKVYSALGVLGARKREQPDLVIGVTGCVAQVEAEEILERAPWVDFVLGTGQVERLAQAVETARRERRRFTSYELPQESPVYQFRQITRDSAYQAYVTIIEGCDQFCTFCIVPFTRGRERSRAGSEVLEELRHLAASGYSEVTLLGQTVNAYREPEEGFGLGELLRRAARVEGIRRLRFLTSHPRLMDDAMVEALSRGGAIAPYLHLPAQSGSDRVLFRMKRRYDSRTYRALIRRIRSEVPGIAVSSDFIVGFPGETEEDFRETFDLVEEVRFESLFAFRYSSRPGTASARWGSASEIPEAVGAERLSRLLALQERIQLEINRSLEGRQFEVLIEGKDRKGQSRGRTPCNRIVHIEGAEPIAPGSYARVRIVRGLPNSLIGELARASRPEGKTAG